MTTRLVFAHKGVEFDRVDPVAGVHKSHEQPDARRIALSILPKARLAVGQIGLAARLLMACDDLHIGIEGRPAGVLAPRVARYYPVPAGRRLPLEWLRWTTT
jgi:hypothetical protein